MVPFETANNEGTHQQQFARSARHPSNNKSLVEGRSITKIYKQKKCNTNFVIFLSFDIIVLYKKCCAAFDGKRYCAGFPFFEISATIQKEHALNVSLTYLF